MEHATKLGLGLLLCSACALAAAPTSGTLLLTEQDTELCASAEKLCPELLALRLEIDRAAERYRLLQLALGTAAVRSASRESPRLRRSIERALERLGK